MLGRLEMTVNECMVAYIELSKDIFPEESTGQSSWWLKMFRLVSAYRTSSGGMPKEDHRHKAWG